MSEEPKEITAEDTDAVLATSAELGPAYDGALAESFADRVEQVIEARVAERTRAAERESDSGPAAGTRQMILGFVSLGAGIPITAVAGGTADLPGVVAAWAGIAAINVAHALAGRRPH